MRRMMMFLAAMTIIAFAYTSASVLAEGMKDPMGKTNEDPDLGIGKAVMNIQGDKLGTVKSFVRDSDGKVAYALVSHNILFGLREKKVAIPYSALIYDNEKQYFTCDISLDRFTMAPEVKDEAMLRDPSSAEEINRYFGQHPYWTDEPIWKSKGVDDSLGPGAWK